MDFLNAVIRCVVVSVLVLLLYKGKRETMVGEQVLIYFFYQEIEGDRR